ncbi:MAG: hypothetical protein IEMM0007_0799 [bacterium]|nr:MAG: hypothetical protein IEMM0007_0799 [bacterium]
MLFKRNIISAFVLLILLSSCVTTTPKIKVEEYTPSEKFDFNVALIISNELKNREHYTTVNARCETKHIIILKKGVIRAKNTIGLAVEDSFAKGLSRLFARVDTYRDISELKNGNNYDLIITPDIQIDTSYDEEQAINRKINPLYNFTKISEYESFKRKFANFEISVSTEMRLQIKDAKSGDVIENISHDNAFWSSSTADQCTGNENYNVVLSDNYAQLLGFAMSTGFPDLMKDVETALIPYAKAKLKQKTLPANLTTKVQYSDNNSLIPNNTIDAKEESRITVSITNEGKGTAFDVKVKTETDYRNIDFPESVSIGDIQSGETKDVTVNLKAGLNLASGKAPFTIYASEKRGYDSKAIKVLIPAARLEKPDLVFVDYRIDDGNTGLARGNGNGIAESGETIELTAFIKNEGQGKAIGVNMSAGEINTGIQWVRNEMEVGIIPPGRTVKAKVAFTIPRNFDAKEIRSLLKVSDIRGVSSAKKKITLAYSKESPELRYAYRILSHGKEVKSVINGEQYKVELTVSNRGKLSARNVVTSITPYKEIQIDRRSIDMGEIKAGSSHPVPGIGLYIPRTFMESRASLKVGIEQTDFRKSEGVIEIPVQIKSPRLSYTANLLGKRGGNIIEKGESAILEIHVLNEGSLPAEAVTISIKSTDEDMNIFGKDKYVLGRIPAESRSEIVRFRISTRRRIHAGEKYLKINIDQKDFPSVSSEYALNITEENLRIIDLAAEDSKKTSVTGVSESNRAPSITIISPQSGETVDDNKVYLAVDVADFKSIESVRVKVNGLIIPIRDNVGGLQVSKQRKVRINVPLKEGANNIVIYAANSDNIRARREIVITRRAEEDVDTPLVTNIKNPDAIAVVIGISRYENHDIPTVDYARHDAETMKKYLVRTLGYKEENIIERLDSKASFAQFRAIFKKRLGNRIIAGKSDVFIFYSGHGVPGIENKQPYLVPYDFDPEAIEDTGYNLNDFYKEIGKLKAKSVTIVIDACFSGSSEKGMVIKGISPVFLEVDNPVMKVKNSVVFTSSTGRQISSWYYKKRHGLFTYYFLKGLRGAADADKDGKITAGEMEKYLSFNVLRKARSLRNREQTPQEFGDKKRVLLSY